MLITLKDHLKHHLCLFFIYHQGYIANRTLQFSKRGYSPPSNYIQNYAGTKELFFHHQSITNILKLNCIHTYTINLYNSLKLEVFALLGSSAMYVGSCLPMLWGSLLVPSSRGKHSINNFPTLEDLT